MSREELLALRHETVSLRPRVEQLRSQESKSEWSRHELMSLTAVFIEDVWGSIDNWITEHGMALPIVTARDSYDFVSAPADLFKGEKDAESVLQKIEISLLSFIENELFAWEEEKESELNCELPPGDLEAALMQDHYLRLESMILEDKERKGETQTNTALADYLKGGFATATNVNMNFLKIIPKAFYQKYGRHISGQEALVVFQNSHRLISTIATMGMNNFFNLAVLLGKEDGVGGVDPTNYDLENFELVEQGDDQKKKISLGIKTEVVAHLRRSAQKTEEATGCPALAAIAPGKKNVVASYNEWITEIAKVHFFPFLDKIKQKAEAV